MATVRFHGGGRRHARRALVGAMLVALVCSVVPASAALSAGGVHLVPEDPSGVGNCIPFANNTAFGFSGFVYRDVPAFTMRPGTRFAFDLGGLNDVEVRRDIYLSATDREPSAADPGVRATSWTQIVGDEQVPENAFGNTVVGDYELVYTAEASFEFGGGGLAVGFGAAPPGDHMDTGCEQVVVHTSRNDPSGYFYARFWNRPHLTSEGLDAGFASSRWIAGLIVHPDVRVVGIDVLPGSDRNPLNIRARGVVPVAVLSEVDFDAVTEVVRESLTFGGSGDEPSLRTCGSGEDVNGDGLDDLVCHFDRPTAAFTPGTEEAVLRGEATTGSIEGRDAVHVEALGRR